MGRYEDLAAWRLCDELAHAVYDATESWPSAEKYGLTSQIRRATCSAASTIAEGAARRGPQDFGRFLDMTLGSLAETRYILTFAARRGWLEDQQATHLANLCARARHVTMALRLSLHKEVSR